MKVSPDWVHHFVPYTWTHLCVVLAFALLVAAMVVTRSREIVADNPPRRRRMDAIIGWIALAVAFFVQGATLWPSRFDYRTSLPLHVCAIGMFIAPLALILRRRPLRAIAYFWGLGLSSTSFVYPDLYFGPGDFQFWVFWAGHAAIVGPALYDITARGFRPHWHDLRLVIWCTIAYLCVIFPFDALLHVNYGYLGQTFKGQRSPIDFLGPWPARAILLFLLAMLCMFLLLVPWSIYRKIIKSRSPASPISPIKPASSVSTIATDT